jgi:hypothetical protein
MHNWEELCGRYLRPNIVVAWYTHNTNTVVVTLARISLGEMSTRRGRITPVWPVLGRQCEQWHGFDIAT